jgi:hypothetical protein
MFLLRDKLITLGEKRETSTQNLQRNNVARQVEGFCISYFAAFTVRVKKSEHFDLILTGQLCTDQS